MAAAADSGTMALVRAMRQLAVTEEFFCVPDYLCADARLVKQLQAWCTRQHETNKYVTSAQQLFNFVCQRYELCDGEIGRTSDAQVAWLYAALDEFVSDVRATVVDAYMADDAYWDVVTLAVELFDRGYLKREEQVDDVVRYVLAHDAFCAGVEDIALGYTDADEFIVYFRLALYDYVYAY